MKSTYITFKEVSTLTACFPTLFGVVMSCSLIYFLTVIEPHPLVKQRMSRMLSIRPREITNVWSGGLFGCFDDGAICILTCFCPCVQFGLNMAYNEHDHLKCCNFECCTCRSKAFFSSCIIQAMVIYKHTRGVIHMPEF